VLNGPVGCGSSAAVLYMPSNNTDPLIKSYLVGTSLTSEESDTDAILLGIDTLIDKFRDISRKHTVKDVYILSDSASAIKTVDTDWLTHNIIQRLELIFQHLE